MRFDLYPLDSHICKFRVGSTNLDITRMRFAETAVKYDATARNTILDYAVDIGLLKEEDRYVCFASSSSRKINLCPISESCRLVTSVIIQ